MANLVDVNVVEDYSIQKRLNKKAKQLSRKYSTKRQINEKLIAPKSKAKKAWSIVFDCICTALVVIAGILCFSAINSKIQRVCPTFFGYSNMTVVSGSMVNSGLKIGDKVVVQSVDASTIKEGDIISFYAYSADYNRFDINSVSRVDNDTIADTKYVHTFASLFGYQPKALVGAASSGASLVIHHVRAVYEDENGTRWFKTYGSSNASDDTWYISENMVVGKYNNSGFALVMSKAIAAFSSKFGVVLLLIPILLLAGVIIIESLKNVQLAKLELDCVEEKRKITDPICIKYNIGYNMDTNTKYKILAQAEPENYNEYISLLWKNGTAPSNIRKYYIKKNILLAYNCKMLELNRECEKMFADGVKPTKIAKYYLEQKAALQSDQRAKEQKIKSLAK